MQSGTIPVIVRFSDATGVPNIPDANGNGFPKGMAIRFQLPDAAIQTSSPFRSTVSPQQRLKIFSVC